MIAGDELMFDILVDIVTKLKKLRFILDLDAALAKVIIWLDF